MSNFIGKIGKQIAADITITGFVWRPEWNTDVKLYLMNDADKNILTMRTAAKFTVGQKWRIEGKVKRHHYFNSQKQTHIADWSLQLI